MNKALAILVLGAAFSATWQISAASAGDWAQWRGPARDGISTETGLLQEWPAGGPPLAWKASGLGKGHATVAVVGDQVFTLGDLGDQNFIIALSRDGGKPLWKTPLGKAGAPGWGGFAGPRCMPTVDDGLVYAVGQYGEVACVKASDGAVVWTKDYAKDFAGELQEWGYTGMPLIDGNQVILTPGGSKGNLVALNKKTGELIWQSKDLKDGLHYSSPIVVEIAGVRQYIQLTDASIAGIAAKDGQLLWRAARKGATAVIPTPIYSDSYVYVTSEYGTGCNLFKVSESGGKFSAEQVYANKVMLNHHGGVIKLGENVYGHSSGKGWTCQDLKTGKAIWQEKQKAGKGAIAYAEGRFYLRAEDGKGTITLIEATPNGYSEKGRFDQPERTDKNSWAHPVIAGGKLYIRDQDTLLCYDVRAKK